MRLLVLSILLAAFSSARADTLPGLPDALKSVTTAYLAVQQKLASDSFDGVTAAASAMQSAMTGAKTPPFAPDFVQAVNQLVAAKDLHSARIAFQAVSNSMIAALAQNHAQTGSLHVAFCPMVKAYWVQTDGKTIHNPYYGGDMSDCGSFQRQY